MSEFSGWTKPSLSETKDRVLSDIDANLPGQNVQLRYSPLNCLGAALAGQSWEQQAYIEWAVKQTTVLYCDDENLEHHGEIWGVDRQIPTYANGTITCTGTNTTVIPAGTIFAVTDLQYVVQADATISSGTATVSVKAIDIGSKFNLTASTKLTISSAISGVTSTATAIAISGGTDKESASSYRSRILSRIQNPPQGGSKSDYVAWAKTMSGVTRAWCYPLEGGAGTATVRFMMDDIYPIVAGSTTPGENGIPTSTDVTNMTAIIEANRPITAVVTVVAPTPVPLNLTITGLMNNDVTTKANVTNEIYNAIVRDSEPGQPIKISRIWAAISLATGEQYFTSTTPNTDITYTVNQIAVPGTITWA